MQINKMRDARAGIPKEFTSLRVRCPFGFLFAILVASTLWSASGKLAHAQPSDSDTVIATPSFSLTDETLKKGQRGVDIEKLLAAILKTKPPTKSEFESKADFDLRMTKFSERKFLGDIGPGSRIAVLQSVTTFPADDYGERVVKVQFDAESEKMAVEMSSELFCGLTLKRNIVPKRQYTATNGFGQKVTVTEVDETKTCLIFGETGKVKFPLLSLDVEFSLSKKDAASVKPNLGVVVIGRLAQPYSEEERSHERPTGKYPVEKNIVRRSIVLNVEDVWVINTTTGLILAKRETPLANSPPLLAENLDVVSGTCKQPSYHMGEVPNRSAVVEMEFEIDLRGAILSSTVKQSSGVADLDKRAIGALSKCKFRPAMRDGIPVLGVALIKFHFN
jgi:TonB family protein